MKFVKLTELEDESIILLEDEVDKDRDWLDLMANTISIGDGCYRKYPLTLDE